MSLQSEARQPADARLPRPGDVIAGKYRIDGFIARGGMGAVLSATHQVTGRRLALKWLLYDPGNDAEASHRLVREARAAARVRHPNVVDVYDIGEHDGALFLVMELLEGDTLSALLRERGKLDPHTTLELLVPALRGVEAAHRNQVLHRDLKPSNIFLCRTPDSARFTPRVLDFGISKILAEAGDGEHSLTRTGAVLGTPQYMAKEQLCSEEVDERADIYAMGVIAYQCLTGRLPFRDSNYNALVVQIATATPTPIAQLTQGLPPGLDAVVMRAMAREPAARFGSVAELLAALSPFELQVAHDAGATRSNRVWALMLAVSLLVAVAAWAIWRVQGGPVEPVAPHPQPAQVARSATAPTATVQAPAEGSAPTATVPADAPAAAPAVTARDAPAKTQPIASDERHRRSSTATTQPTPTAGRAAEPVREPTEGPVPISLDQF